MPKLTTLVEIEYVPDLKIVTKLIWYYIILK